MNLEIVSYNGFYLNEGGFSAYFPVPSVMLGPEVDVGEVERSYFAPISTYKKRKSKYLFIHILMSDDTIASDVDTLNALFNPYDPYFHELLVRDTNDNNKQYYVMGTPASHPSNEGQELVVSLKIDDPIWKTKQDIETSWAVTATGDQETIAVSGSFYSEPTFEITPTAAKSGGKAYRIFCPVYNPSTTITYTDYPLDIVNNALDTAALVADSTRHVTINDGDGITDADATITYDGAVGTFPTSGLAYLGTEQITYTGKSATELTGCTRGVNGTSAAAHANDVVIYASKMEADGGDIQVLVDGVAVNYWLQDINNATTQVWINVYLSAGYTMTNGVLIADSGAITTITLENSTANIDAINALPSTGVLMIDSELFSYTGKNVTTRQFTGVNREAFGTAAAEHTVGDYVRWIEHEIFIYHGVHDLPAFTTDDTYKPDLELDSSNAAWTWDATFTTTDADSLFILDRPSAWRQRTPDKWDDTSPFVGNQYYNVHSSLKFYYESMSTSAPSTQTTTNSKTMSVLGNYFANLGYSEGYGGWCIHIPSGFSHVAATGNRWLSSAAGTDWFLTSAGSYAFRAAHDENETTVAMADFHDAFSVDAPAMADTVDAWTQITLDLGDSYYYFMVMPNRAVGNRDGEVRLETDTLTLTLISGNAPVAFCGSSTEYYHVNAELWNTTTGEYLTVDHYLNLNTDLHINTSAKTVVDEESGQYERGAIALSNYRHDWLKLTPGTNVLQWNETGATGLTIVVKRRERKL